MRWEDQRVDTAFADALPLELSWQQGAGERGGGKAGLNAPSPEPIESGTHEALAIEIQAKSIINKIPGSSPMPFRYTINPYRGCSHACRYCFARRTHSYLDLDSGQDFDSKIFVKVNAGSLLRRELAAPKWAGEGIAMGTNTDPYQRAEGRYRLMRDILAALCDHANPFSILTKGTLILRDMDLITQAARATEVNIAVSVGFIDDELWRAVEPGTPRPQRRLDVIRRCADAGIGCSVLMAPILPGLTDDQEHIDRTVSELVTAGARDITALVLHLRPGAREWYRGWLDQRYPHLGPLYDRLYERGSYTPASYRSQVAQRVRAARRRFGLPEGTAEGASNRGARRTKQASADDESGVKSAAQEQLTLL